MLQDGIVGSQVAIICPHGGIGTVITGSENVKATNMPSARVGDLVICNFCGCLGAIATGSPNVKVNSRPSSRVSDITVGICDPGLPCCPHEYKSCDKNKIISRIY